MAFPRRVEPEWLDSLPNEDPDAAASRRDLRRLNSLMWHATILARIFSAEPNSAKPRSLLDIGSGDGTFMLALARKLAKRMPGVIVTMVDKNTGVSEETRGNFSALGWEVVSVKADVLDYLDNADAASTDAVIANLFLHHFSDAALTRLFSRAAAVAPLFAACEPLRAWFPMAASRLLWTIGCNKVTQHDASASVRAGFRDKELSLLWPEDRRWQTAERRAGPFSHCFVARHVA
ncbi:MAG TPA: methyltransferase domain-containing protein [Aestuariivirgaceae bacterium]|nr:methyltransferase domain-containing protein [Aestuariivirgaceae bacterium]